MKIMIVAGGTGGHLYPGIALARALIGHEVTFVVRRGDLGREILKREGFPVREISGQGMPRTLSLKAITFPLKFIRGWAQAWRLLKELRPDGVVGMGGYLSFPVILIARRMNIRTMLHEQNVLPGLSNRLLGRWADSVAVSFPASQAYFKGCSVWVSGLPIRPEVGAFERAAALQHFAFSPRIKTILIFGGSLGARRLNSLVMDAWAILGREGFQFQVIHVTGMKDFERVEPLYRKLNLSASVMPYCHEMAEAYAAADAVICRAGASTVAELLAARRPAFLVPYPYASDNHQVNNAEVLVKAGLGVMVLERDLQPAAIAEFLKKIAADESFQRAFETAARQLPADLNPADAAARLAQRITA